MSDTSDTYGIKDAKAILGPLVRRCAVSRERILITDHGQPVAVLMNPAELADLEDELALTKYQLAKANGTLTTDSHEDVIAAVYAGDAAENRGAA
ncbi:hypothetical protein SRB5_45410 [Streptomyces sp. RB5]|uniref:Antitoxin n=1 Tax=Streptomyces smaragdinus TaxID=2585196 RepID=A0A7K0CLL4_9ACTN|nr:type II toxin-antitoxin system Phd/YefM family antitoxin [Streptomyces smaragdinus]MQY14375.1 hypothetical protein [Streptomyces smaragdinus]